MCEHRQIKKETLSLFIDTSIMFCFRLIYRLYQSILEFINIFARHLADTLLYDSQTFQSTDC